MFSFSSSRKTALFTLLLLSSVSAVAILARAQTPDPAPASASAPATLTIDQIGQALDTYGKNTVSANGHTEYNITVPKGKWNINVLISLSPNGKVIWLTNNLADVSDLSKISATALANLLKKNSDIGPMFFSITNDSLRISYPLPNYELTPASFRQEIDGLISTVLDTAPLWNPDALAGKTPAPEPTPPTPNNPLSK